MKVFNESLFCHSLHFVCMKSNMSPHPSHGMSFVSTDGTLEILEIGLASMTRLLIVVVTVIIVVVVMVVVSYGCIR